MAALGRGPRPDRRRADGSFGFNPQITLLTDPTWEPGNNRLIYQTLRDVRDTPWAQQLAGGPYWTVHRPDGNFDLISEAGSARLGRDELVVFPNQGSPAQPEFGPPYRVTFDGFPFSAVPPETPDKPVACHAVDFDGDGMDDLLFLKLEDKEYPDGVNFWQHRVTRYAGPGRSYAVNGDYLADNRRAEFFWARGGRNDAGQLVFSAPLPVYQGREDFPLIWKGPGHARGAAMTIDGQRYLVLYGSLEQLLAVPFELEGDVIRCGRAVPFLADDAVVDAVYMPHHMSVADLDGDGNDELLVTGNPGSLAVFHGPAVGQYREAKVLGRGGAVRMQTLIVPQRLDVDGDAFLDLLIGDAGG